MSNAHEDSFAHVLSYLRNQFGIGIREDYLGSLYAYVMLASQNNQTPTIVELGCEKGLSTLVMASALHNCQKKGRIYTIDPAFSGPVLIPDAHQQDGILYTHNHKEFIYHAKTLGVESYIQKIAAYSWDVLESWTKPIDLLFIDSEHTYSAMLKDCEWFKHILLGGYIAIDDWFNDIESAVRYYLSNHPGYTILHESTSAPHDGMIVTLLRKDFNNHDNHDKS